VIEFGFLCVSLRCINFAAFAVSVFYATFLPQRAQRISPQGTLKEVHIFETVPLPELPRKSCFFDLLKIYPSEKSSQ